MINTYYLNSSSTLGPIRAIADLAEQRIAAPLADDRTWFIGMESQILEGSNEEISALQFARLRAAFAFAQYWYSSGDASRAICFAECAAKIAHSINEQSDERRAHNMLGVFESSLGRRKEACVHFARAIELARACNEPFLEASVWANVSNTAYDGGQFTLAVQVAERALRLVPQQSNQTPKHNALRAQANQLIARSYVAMGRFTEAKAAIALARGESANAMTAFDIQQLIMLAHTSAVLSCIDDDLEAVRTEANLAVSLALRLAKMGVAHKCATEVVLCQALSAAAEGKPVLGLEMIDQILVKQNLRLRERVDLLNASLYLRRRCGLIGSVQSIERGRDNAIAATENEFDWAPLLSGVPMTTATVSSSAQVH
jgi:hypothetical protein